MTSTDPETCPTIVELELFYEEGKLDKRIAGHLDNCLHCKTILEDIDANNNLLSKLQSVEINLKEGQQSASLEKTSTRPESIEGYEILEEIERGGQGIIYKATQRATNRTVALKLLLAGTFATSQQRRRFEREIELIADLYHPNIVTVYDSGKTSDECHYLAMQYVEGLPLDEWISNLKETGNSTPAQLRDDLLELFCEICAGISYAHQHGVIHRDLKPANILIDGEGLPHIVDFGLAKPIIEDLSNTKGATIEGAFLGTIAYSSPEQIKADPSLIDTRTDVYTLGVILYQLLTGMFPYAVEGDFSEVLKAISSEQPVTPSTRKQISNNKIPLPLDDELDTIVLKALNKDKDRRYQSVSALREDISRYLRNEPIDAKRDSNWYVFKKSLVRNRTPVIIAASFVAILIVSTISLLIAYQRATIEANKVKQINIFLEDTLGSVVSSEAGKEVTVRELLDEAVQWIDIALSDQPETAASIQTTVANSFRNLGLFEEAEIQVRAALETRRSIFGEEHKDVAQCLNLLGLIRRDQNLNAESERYFTEALAMRRRTLGEKHYDVSLTLANLASIKRKMGELGEATALLNESMAIRRNLFGNNHSDVAMCLYNLAMIAEDDNDPEMAIRLHSEALEIRRNVLHPEHPDLPRSLYSLGSLLGDEERFEESIRLFAECAAMRRSALGDNHRLVVETRIRLSKVYLEAKEFEKAESELLATYEVIDAEQMGQSGQKAALAGFLAQMYEEWGKEKEASDWRKKALGDL